MTNLMSQDDCPCLSGNSYSECCEGLVDWNSLIQKPLMRQLPHLSIRGKNLLFIERIAEVLQLNNLKNHNLLEYKKLFTEDAVKSIYEAFIHVWPPDTDCKAIFAKEKSSNPALYVGNYHPEYLHRALARLSLYADKILFLNPLPYPFSYSDEFNPLLNPSEHRSNTFRWINLWFSLIPWIQSGIVIFVPNPTDFDIELKRDLMTIQKSFYNENPELREVLDNTIKRNKESSEMQDFKSYQMLLHDDAYLYAKLQKDSQFKSVSRSDFYKMTKQLRESHPLYLDTPDKKDKTIGYLTVFSGAGYIESKMIAEMSGAFIVTDLDSRWKEMEIDRKKNEVTDGIWSPFSKAFQKVDLKFLNNIPIGLALRLREEGRLQEFRMFLRRTWRASAAEEFSDENPGNLAAELSYHVAEADQEWKKIDQDLAKWFGVEIMATIGAITSGGGIWAAAGFATAASTHLLLAGRKRKDFLKHFPAGLFVNLPS